MKRYNRNIRLVFFIIAAFLCSSCRMTEKGLDYHNDSHFLFIPVDSEQTSLWLMVYLLLILFLFIYKILTQAQVGWHQHEVKNNIYDNDGHIIGSVGTGEYYETYTSQESADKSRNNCIMIQLAATIALANGIICSWIFAGGSVIFYISFIVLTIVGFIKTIRNEKLKETILSLQLWIGIICTILFIIYCIISRS